MKILIATSKQPPNQLAFDEVCKGLRDYFKQDNLEIINGIIWTSGPGCSNLSFELAESNKPIENIEKAVNCLTMNLMPAKWTTTNDPLPAVDTFEL